MKETQVQQQIEEGGGEVFHTKYLPDQTPEITPNIEVRINAIVGSGQPWPESVRAYFVPQSGVDFSQVRLHSDVQVVESFIASIFLSRTECV